QEEVEEGRWAAAARLQNRRLADEHSLARAERFGLTIDRNLGCSCDLVEYAVGRRYVALFAPWKNDTHGFEMKRHIRHGWQFGRGDHCSGNCRWDWRGLCGCGGSECHCAEQ